MSEHVTVTLDGLRMTAFDPQRPDAYANAARSLAVAIQRRAKGRGVVYAPGQASRVVGVAPGRAVEVCASEDREGEYNLLTCIFGIAPRGVGL